MSETYKGRYQLVNPAKYRGDREKIFYRSLWERQALRWCDNNPDVEWFNSEETVVPYKCPTDNMWHRYFVDLTIKFKNGNTLLVEVKPSKQCKMPKKTKGKSKARYIEEVLMFAKNKAKWEAADEYAKKHGMRFQVWTEQVLETIGIKLLTK